jgi:hypothetical protein
LLIPRLVIPDLSGEPSHVSIPDPGKRKAREITMEEPTNVWGSKELWYDGEPVIRDGGYIEPRKVGTPEERRLPVAGPSNQPATVVAPAAAPSDPVAPLVPELVPEPAPVVDPATQALTRILEVAPNVDPEFLYPLIATHLPNFDDDPSRTAAFIVDTIFEMGDKVPKVKGNVKGKRKTEGGEGSAGNRGEGKEQADDDDERKGKKVKVDWASVDRPFTGTGNYIDLALVFHLLTDKRAYIVLTLLLDPPANFLSAHAKTIFTPPTHVAQLPLCTNTPPPFSERERTEEGVRA